MSHPGAPGVITKLTIVIMLSMQLLIRTDTSVHILATLNRCYSRVTWRFIPNEQNRNLLGRPYETMYHSTLSGGMSVPSGRNHPSTVTIPCMKPTSSDV